MERMSDGKLTRTDPHIIHQLYNLLELTHDILKELKIEHWITCGSLLGAVRHQSIIPWDDDIDLAMIDSQTEILWENQDKFQKRGLSLVEYKFGYKVFHQDSPMIPNYNHGFPFLDIFVMVHDKIEGRDSLVYKNKQYRIDYPEHFLTEELFPLTNYKLGKYTLPGPHKYRPFLDRVYGTDWKEVGRTHTLDHITKESLETYEEFLS